MILYRPVGTAELELIHKSGDKEFPPRLPEQPIFYPVLNEQYACEIAEKWNAKTGDGFGYVTRFEIDDAYGSQFEVHTVGNHIHQELWVPAESLTEFNAHIKGVISVIKIYYETKIMAMRKGNKTKHSRQFRQYLKRGHGRCFVVLKSTTDVENYREDVLWGCLNGFAFDAQCEGSRAAYIYRLVCLLPDREAFVPAISDKFLSLNTRKSWEHLHFSELLSFFAEDGSKLAEKTLREKYNDLYNKMIAKKWFGLVDFEKECLEYLAIIFGLRNINGWIDVASDLGKLAIANDHYRNQFCFDWFLFYSRDKYTEKRLLNLLEKKKSTSKSLSVFYDLYVSEIKAEKERYESRSQETDTVPAVEKLIEDSQNGQLIRRDAIRFRRQADADEKKRLAEKLEKENDPEKKADLLTVFFSTDYPGSKSKLIEYTESANANLRENAIEVFISSRGSEIVSHALALLKQKKNQYAALCALIVNYKSDYKSLILDELKTGKLSDEELHKIVMTINSVKDNAIHLPREFFDFAYEYSPCACCREHIVYYMSKHGWLTDEIINECVFDCNNQISKFVGRYYKSRIDDY